MNTDYKSQMNRRFELTSSFSYFFRLSQLYTHFFFYFLIRAD